MKSLVCISVFVFLLSGCATVCGFTQTQRDKVSNTLHQLQDGYGTMVTTLQANPDSRVQVAVALTDVGLAIAGKVLASWCPSAEEVALLEATAKGAAKAKTEAGLP